MYYVKKKTCKFKVVNRHLQVFESLVISLLLNSHMFLQEVILTIYWRRLMAQMLQSKVIAKDAAGKTVGADSEREEAVAPGATVVIVHSFNVDNAASFEPTLACKKDKYYESITQDLTYEVSDTGKGLVVTCTNTGTEAMSWVIGTVLFFNGSLMVL